MKTMPYLLLFCLCLPLAATAQTQEAGDIFTKISNIISGMPGDSGDDYQEPSPMEMSDWVDVLDDLFAGNYGDADTEADSLGYDLVEFSDNTTNETYYVLEKLPGSDNFWGTYVLNPNADRSEIVLMAPHPKFDFNTGKQGIYCFKEADAGFFMMAGTHRCNNATASTCSGTTEACGASAAYRISDLAHVVNSIWQLTTEYLAGNFPNSYFIQLHGFTKGASDPYVIMSNGTRETPSPDPVTAIRDELLVVDPVLTFKIAHIDLAWDRLIGFTNTNGRSINASNNACTANATATSGRFVHIEQEKTRLRDNAAGWQKMATALAETFPLAPLPVELADFSATLQNGKVQLTWTTHAEAGNDFFEIQRSTDGRKFSAVGTVAGRGNSATPQVYGFWDAPVAGTNFYRLRQVDFDGRAAFSKTVTVVAEGDGPGIHVFSSGHSVRVQLERIEAGEVHFRLYDGWGRLVKTANLAEGENVIPMQQMPGTFYFFQVDDGRQLLRSGKLGPGF